MTAVPDIRLRRAEPRDREAVFALSNDSVVRANSIHTEPISWETHVAWFVKAMTDPNIRFYIAETLEGDFIGEVRFARETEGWVVTIHLMPNARGKGFGTVIMRQAIVISRFDHYVSYVKPNNLASLRLFMSLGFKNSGSSASGIGKATPELVRLDLELLK